MPEPPPGLMQALWFDMSPMRPDEWARTDAQRWRSAIAMRNAYHAGEQDAKGEAEAKERAEKMWAAVEAA